MLESGGKKRLVNNRYLQPFLVTYQTTALLLELPTPNIWRLDRALVISVVRSLVKHVALRLGSSEKLQEETLKTTWHV